jgi:hypothetical protein
MVVEVVQPAIVGKIQDKFQSITSDEPMRSRAGEQGGSGGMQGGWLQYARIKTIPLTAS